MKIDSDYMPYSSEAESALIGSLILGDGPETHEAVELVPRPDMLYVELHRTIYRELLAVRNAKTLDIVVLHDRVKAAMKDSDESQSIGDYLVGCASSVPSAVNALYYARIVADKYRIRSAILSCLEVSHRLKHLAATDDTSAALASAFETIARAFESKPRGDVSLADAMDEVLRELRSGSGSRFTTGISGIDEVNGGVWAPGINTVLGVPGSGKSSFVLGAVMHAVRKYGVGAAVFSYEMNPQTIASNILAQESGRNIARLRRLGLPPDTETEIQLGDAIDRCRELNVHLIEDYMNADQILSRARYLVTKGVRIVVIDYIQHLPLVNGMWGQVDNITHTMDACRRMARELGLCVWAVSQVSKNDAREPRPPKMSDGIGSGSIEQRSDMIITVFRPCAWENPAEYVADNWRARQRECTIGVAKDKSGPIGSYPVRFVAECFRFEDEQQAAPEAW